MKKVNVIISLALFLLPLHVFLATGVLAGPATRDNAENMSAERSTRQDSWQKTAEKELEEMCEFLQMDQKQTDDARKLFASRIKEMEEIFESASNGELNSSEARDKLAESFKKHREKFEALLNEEQRARLELWENHRSAPESKDRRS